MKEKKKKEVRDMTKNGRDFKLIISYGPEGNIFSVMEKPNITKTLSFTPA